MKDNVTESAIERFQKDFAMVLTKYHQNLLDAQRKEERTVYGLSEMDLQSEAETCLGRHLTEEELEDVREKLRAGMLDVLIESIQSVDK